MTPRICAIVFAIWFLYINKIVFFDFKIKLQSVDVALKIKF